MRRLWQSWRGFQQILVALGLASLFFALPAPASLHVPSLLPTAVQSELQQGDFPLQQRILRYEAERLTQQRQVFLEAEAALEGRQWSQYGELSHGLHDYPLYPYLRLEYLSRRLDKVDPGELQQFLSNYAETPMAGILRHRILLRAARSREWETYAGFYVPQSNVELQCHYLNALIATGRTEQARPQFEHLWLYGRSRPKACDPAFAAWQEAGRLSDDLIWQRLTLAIAKRQHRLVRYLARQLPKEEQRLALRWHHLYGKPEQLLRQYKPLLNDNEKSKIAFVSVLRRLAQRDPEKAAEFWLAKGTAFSLTTDEQYAFFRALGTALARQHLPGAEDWFVKLPQDYHNEDSRLWRARAALREANWQNVHTAIEAMTAAEQQEERWLYWRARALLQLGREQEALALFNSLATERSYYGFLAADRLGLPYSLNAKEHDSSLAALFTVSQDPAIKRAYEFFQLKRINDARREWNFASTSLDDSQRSHAAKLAQLWGWHDQSIHTMAHTSYRDDIELRFPLLFQDQVSGYSRQQNIETAWTYAIIRRESAFTPDIRSPAGAIGLMQLMPATARGISRRHGIKYRGSAQLTTPEVNLALGTTLMAKMMEQFGQQQVLATAAYNAGANRIKRWLPEGEVLEADRWIETIPFEETREYVSGVLAYTIIYYHRLGQTPKRLSQLMPKVASWEVLQTQGILTAQTGKGADDV